MDFYFNLQKIGNQANGLEGIENAIAEIESQLQGVCDGISGLSLDAVKPNINALISRLAKNKNCVSEMKDALNRITKLYYQVENKITGYGMMSPDLYVAGGLGDQDILMDYSDLMEEYGLSDITIRYLADYYPELLEELRNSSNPDEVLARINELLKNNHITMMEDYGYSYEAIKYLLDNSPGMISSLYATSHWSTSDVDDVRMAIYNLCHENDICVYDPEHDFDAYNFDVNNFDYWQFYNGVQTHTNCYAYAFGLTHDPRTGELLPFGGLQPGYFSGQEAAFDADYSTVYSADNEGQLLVEYVTADAQALDLNFVPYEEGMTGGQRVALVINPIDGGDNDVVDYHWYFYDEETGSWYNKQGIEPASNYEIPNLNPYSHMYNLGTHYPDGSQIYICSDDDNIYLVVNEPDTPIESWEQHAEDNGYTVVVGEFYITREDGGIYQ